MHRYQSPTCAAIARAIRRSEIRSAVTAAYARLPREDRWIIIMSVVDGMTPAEIAAAMAEMPPLRRFTAEIVAGRLAEITDDFKAIIGTQ